MLLAISAGNSNVKAAFHCGIKWFGPWSLPARPLPDAAALSDWYARDVRPQLPMVPIEAAFLSVVPEMNSAIEAFLKAEKLPAWRLSSSRYAALSLGDSIPETTGADRIANILAAKKRFGAPAIAVDFGTATAITAVDAKGVFAGGAILPGVDLQIRSLNQGTAQLPDVPVLTPESALGKDTVSAIQAGVVRGHLASVQGLLLDACAELGIKPGSEPSIVCTGGRASLFAELSPLLANVDDLLTFEGLRIALAAR